MNEGIPTAIDFSYMLSLGIQGLFFVLLIVFAFHALFLAYHWFSYGNSRSISMTALGIYLGGGATLFLTYAFAMILI